MKTDRCTHKTATAVDSPDNSKVLMTKLIAANEKRIVWDQRNQQKPRFNDSAESIEVNGILSSIRNEPESMLSFSTHQVVKFMIFDIIAGLLENAKTDQFKRKCLKTLKSFMDNEYDSINKCFTHPKLVSRYGAILFRIIHCLNDLTIDESFYCDEEADYSGFQEELLVLVNYVLKSVSLGSIIRIGFKPKHLQFLIIHFTKSPYVPEIILSISENLHNSSQLYENSSSENTVKNEYIKYVSTSCFEILIKSINLMIKLYSSSAKILGTIQKANWYLADYVRQNISSICVTKQKHHMIKMTQFIVKDIVKKIRDESKSKYRSMKYQQLNIYLLVLISHFDNLTEDMKKKQSQPLVFSIRKILHRLAQHESFRRLTKTELLTRNFCFSIIIKIIEISREKFYQSYVEYNNLKYYFEQIWLNGINNYCEMACLAFITFLRTKHIPKFAVFINRVLTLINKRIKLNGIEIKNFSLHLRILVSIVDYYSLNLYKDELKSLLKPVLVKAIKKLNEVSHLDSYSLIMKLQFIHKIFQVSFTAQTRPTGLYHDIVVECMQDFKSIICFETEFQIDENIYLECLELVRLIIKFFRPDNVIKQYRLVLIEILYQIEFNLNADSDFYVDDKCEVERMLNFLETNQ